MTNIISFDVSVVGKSHETSKLPCQDFGLSIKKDEVYVAIACDGHGSKSYVRSHIGSEIAAEVAYEKIMTFVKSVDPMNFLHQKAAVTAMPIENPLIDKSGRNVDVKDLSESQQEIVKQNIQYIKSIESIPEQENLFRDFFDDINETWKSRITENIEKRPFTQAEKEALGNRDVVKAYGTTLLAFVRTPLYWFSFQIGDGKILCADRNFQWKEPVSWDYSCFLNLTTSLCDNNPIRKFRYAFDGTGNFPIAVTVASDGIDDTFTTQDSLHNFYSLLLCNFHEQGVNKTLKSLELYLPKLSEKGSRDDMTIAGIVDLDALERGVEIFDINSRGNDIAKKRSSIVNEIKHLENQFKSLQEQLKEFNNKIEEINNEIDLNTNKKNSILKELSFIHKQLEDFSDTGKGKVDMLKKNRAFLVEKNDQLALEDKKRWEELVAKIKIEEGEKANANRTQKNKVDSFDDKGTERESKQTDEKTGDKENFSSFINSFFVKWDFSMKLLPLKSTVDYLSSSISLLANENKKNDKDINKEDLLKSENEIKETISSEKSNNDFKSKDYQKDDKADDLLDSLENIDQDNESDKQFQEIKDKSQEEENPS